MRAWAVNAFFVYGYLAVAFRVESGEQFRPFLISNNMTNKFKMMSLFLGLCVCTLGFTACGGDDDDDPVQPNTPEVPNNGGQDDNGNNNGNTNDDNWESDANDPVTADEVKGIGRELLKVTYKTNKNAISSDIERTIEYTYENGKVATITKTTRENSEGIIDEKTKKYTFTYTKDSITVREYWWGESPYRTETYALANGRIVSLSTDSFDETFSYNSNGRLVESNQSWKRLEYNLKDIYVWNNGNLSRKRIGDSESVEWKYSDRKIGDYSMSSPSAVLAIGASSIDSEIDNTLYAEGFFGRQSKNFVSNVSMMGNGIDYEYEFNADGSPSKVYQKVQGFIYSTSTYEWGNYNR